MTPNQVRPPKIDKDYMTAVGNKSNKNKVAKVLSTIRNVLSLLIQWTTALMIVVSAGLTFYFMFNLEIGVAVFCALIMLIATKVNSEVA